MPLYAITCAEDIAGIVYGNVQPAKPSLRGVGSDVQLYESPPPYLKTAVTDIQGWPALKNRWSEEFKQLAADFAESRPTLNPIDGDATCAQCDMQSVCRVKDLQFTHDNLLPAVCE